ncbi:MAG: penicillin-binding protein 1A [Gammaproteobacteria bacterium]
MTFSFAYWAYTVNQGTYLFAALFQLHCINMFKSLLKILVMMCASGLAAVLAVTLYIVPGLPDIDSLRDVRMQVPLRIYSRGNRSLIAEYGQKRRIPVPIETAPRQLIDAFIATEDERYFDHPGVDIRGLTRAAVSLLEAGGTIREGGSTITMQVARNFFLTRERSYIRKLNEIYLAIKIEAALSKEEILELYINKIYLGQRAYGVGAAARVYYGANINELTLAQYAMIAGLPKAPSANNPVSNPEGARERRDHVLRRMLKTGKITAAEFDPAVVAPLTASLHSAGTELEAPYAAEMVRKYMVEQYGDEAYTAGYIVTTTIVEKNQHAANRALQKALLEYDKRHGYRGHERRYNLSPTAGEEEWKQLLQPYSPIGPLYPALVTHVGEQTVSAYLAGIGSIDIEWSGLKWARRYITENVLGPAPKTAADILRPGAVIRITENKGGNWLLSQIPDAEGALVSLEPDSGAALAVVGGFDFYRSKFNRVAQATRQPGSGFKPFIYSAAIANGFSAASIINDAPVVFDDPSIGEQWRPQNYSRRTFGPTSLREALRKSRNLVSIRLLERIGVKRALDHIGKFGFDTDKMPHNLSLALGTGVITPWQLAGAYSVLANGGYRITPYFIEKIVTHEGDTIYQANPERVCRDCEIKVAVPEVVPKVVPETMVTLAAPDAVAAVTGTDIVPLLPDETETGDIAPRYAERAVDEENIWIMHSLLRDVIKRGTGVRAYRELGREDLAGKTGTTNDQRDAWFAGFNTKVVAIAWVGFDRFQALGNNEVGGKAALPMWIEYMRVALKGIPHSVMERPAGLVNIRIDPKAGCKTHSTDPGTVFEVFKPEHLANLPDCETVNVPFTEQNDDTSAEPLF